MPFHPLQTHTAIKITRAFTTIGSAPLLVMDESFEQIFTKTYNVSPPRTELINEVFCANALKLWGVTVPEICLVNIPYELVLQYNAENATPISSTRYRKEHFDLPFFGSKAISPVVDLLDFLPGITSKEMDLFHQPEDLLKIGIFDHWVGNKDRKPDNPNLLLMSDSGKFKFCAIDHTAAFAYLSNYREVRDIMIQLTGNSSILYSPLAKNIIDFLPLPTKQIIRQDILQCMERVLDEFDDMVDVVPQEWGFSKKSKTHLKDFFGDKERNSRIVNYLK